MLLLPGYRVKEKIYEGEDTEVYRSDRLSDKKPVVLKLIKNQYPTAHQIARINYEYETLRLLDQDGTVQLDGLEKYNNTPVIVLEDYTPKSLHQILSKKRFTILEALRLAIMIVDCLTKIHRHRIIHKDINPSNILWNSEKQQVKIIDFSISTTLPKENLEVLSPNVLEGMLGYISPEQTGRMNRGIDYRSDYYSLGVTLYEIFTGELPFRSHDPMELVHAHISKLPKNPHEIDPTIPNMVSNIIMRLMAKNAEDRYQSTYGLKVDLQNCLDQLEKTGKVNDFVLGQYDFTSRFQIPEKLYGREADIEKLLEAFERINESSSELLLVSGYSGIGKSSLVHELQKSIVSEHGYFISGKFDQLKRNVPYDPFIQAINEFVRQILSEDEVHLKQWKKELLAALGANGQVIINLIPDLELVIGKQPSVPNLRADETQHRFELVFKNFIQAIAQRDHPLVIFLDDMQWADLSSLRLLEIFLTIAPISHLLMIGAYRDNEVNATHPFIMSMNKLQKMGVALTDITLKPLHLIHVQHLIADTLHQDTKKVINLAKVSFEKTQGNPFFLNRFLTALYEQNHIEFDSNQNIWTWNIDKIVKLPHTDNVIDIVSNKLQKLSASTQSLLLHAACLGNRFDLKTLASIYEKSSKETKDILQPAIQEGLIVPLDDAYNLISEVSNLNATYHFLHDKVQQAAYSLLPENKKKPLHLKIGRLLLENTSDAKRDEKIFDIIDQLNMGVSLIHDPQEKNELIKLNLKAGQKAKSSGSYTIAFSYFEIALSLFGDVPWATNYELALTLYNEAAEAAFLCGKNKKMNELSKVILDNARSNFDKVNIYVTKINALMSRSAYSEVVALTLSILKELGFNFPAVPKKFHVALEFSKIKLALLGKTMKDLANLPRMTNPDLMIVSNIFSRSGFAVQCVNPLLYSLICLRFFRLILKSGYSDEAPLFYMVYGVLLCGPMGDVEEGYKYGQLGINLAKQLNSPEKAYVNMVNAVFITYWKEPLKNTLSQLLNCYTESQEAGDRQTQLNSIIGYTCYAYHAGVELSQLLSDIKKFEPVAKQHQHDAEFYLELLTQTAKFLLGRSSPSENHIISDYYYDEHVLEGIHKIQNKVRLSFFYYMKLSLSYLFYDYKTCIDCITILDKNTENRSYLYSGTLVDMYESLTYLAIYNDVSSKRQSEYLKKIKFYQKRMKKWANQCEANHMYKYYLVEAELARVQQQNDKAASLYDKAIESARKYELVREEALVNELAAKFYLSCNKERLAHIYMSDAYYAYTKWGAIEKVRHLEQHYSLLLAKEATHAISMLNVTQTQSGSTVSEFLDLGTVIKSSQTIAQEIVLPDLLKKLMHIVIENAGAQKGYLLLEKDDTWTIEAAIDNNQVTVLKSLPLKNNVPTSIINYVIRSKELVLFDDASQSNTYISDPYIVQNQPKSLLCLPLLNQGALSGILYLENNLSTGSFTQDRVTLLNLLSAQIVISLDNAKLYRRTVDLNAAYEHFVPKEFLSFLGKQSILDVKLGDHVKQEMTVMFCDIRNFTPRSEQLTPHENFKYINDYLSYLEPVISRHHGFIDKYIGDAIMALFTSPDEALLSSLAMLRALQKFNANHPAQLLTSIGIGLNTGQLMLGIVGGKNRLEGSVISDAVNIAARTESLTKHFNTPLIITKNTYERLHNPAAFSIRMLETVLLKGKSHSVTIYEVFDSDSKDIRRLKLETKADFEHAITLFNENKLSEAKVIFQHIVETNEADHIARSYLARCVERE